MAWTATETNIINLALMQAGSTIQVVTTDADTPTTNEARAAILLYPVARDYVQSDFDWPFTTTREALGTKSALSNALWGFQYAYPATSLRVRKVYGPTATPPKFEPLPFEVVMVSGSKYIHTNEDTAYVEYSGKVSDATLFDEVYKEALVYYLASKFCLALRAKPEMAKGALDAYQLVMQRASVDSGKEGLAETGYSLVDGSATVTDAAICNMALARVGRQGTIKTLTDQTDDARLCNMFYARSRDHILTDFDWEFATTRVALANQTASTTTLWAYRYDYPSTCLKARRVLSSSGTRKDEALPFQVVVIAGVKYILTNESAASLEYTPQITDPALFSPTFIQLLTYYLSSELCLPLKIPAEGTKVNMDGYLELRNRLQNPALREGKAETTISLFDGTAALTDVAVANIALSRIGRVGMILSFNDATDDARLCSLFYGRARDHVLTDHDWEFATRRVALAGQAASTDTLWAYSYTYPSDCLKARRILGAAGSKFERVPFQVINTGGVKKVLTNEASASLEYTVQVTDPALFSPTFTQSLAYYLGSELCLPLKIDPAVAKACMEGYLAVLKKLDDPALREGFPETTINLTTGATATHIAICNMALARLGGKRMITALTDQTDEARLCNLFFAESVSQVLRSFPWPFATTRAALTPSTATVTNWGFAYVLPADAAFIQEIVNPLGRLVTNDNRVPFELGFDPVAGAGVLYCNLDSTHAPVELLYVSTSVNVNNFDAGFRNALAWKVAGEIAPSLGGDSKLAAWCIQNFQMAISAAEQRASTEGFDGPEPDCSFLTARG